MPVQKITFQLYKDERKALMAVVKKNVSKKLKTLKYSGVRFKSIVDKTGLPKTRISEAYRQRYLGESTLLALIKHSYITMDDIIGGNDFTPEQLIVLRELFL